jgi:hypothetical protein
MEMKMSRFSVWLMFFILSNSHPTSAQSPMQPLTINEVITRIGAANSEVLVAMTTMQNHPLAQALHDAAYERGVPVYILVTQSDTESPSSEINSLVPAGANVRVSDVEENLIVIDRKQLLKGEGLAHPNSEAFVIIDDAGEVARVTNIFIERFKSATVYTPVYLERSNP